MQDGNNIRKSLWIKIISPEGIIIDSLRDKFGIIKSVVAKGVIPSPKFNQLTGEAIFDFEILPDHSPFVAKVSSKSSIKITTDSGEKKYDTNFGGVVTVSHTDNHTLATFTMQDIKLPNVKNNKVSGG